MYHQIARNKRKSVVVVAAFFIIWAAIGYVIGFIASGVSGGISGIIIAAIVAALVVLWSLTLGQQTVLAVSGAQPVTQEQAPVLYDIVSTLAIGAGLPMPKVYIINDPSPNAFATGTSPKKAAITCTTGLLAIMNREELEGVVGHEMSHIRNLDVRLVLIVATSIALVGLIASLLWRSLFFTRGGNSRDGGYLIIILIAAAALLSVVAVVVGPLMQFALSRSRESLADASSVELTRNPAGLLHALQKLQQNDKPVREVQPRHGRDVHRRSAAASRRIHASPLRHASPDRGAHRRAPGDAPGRGTGTATPARRSVPGPLGRREGIGLRQVRRAQREVGGRGVLLEVLRRLRPRDGHHVGSPAPGPRPAPPGPGSRSTRSATERTLSTMARLARSASRWKRAAGGGRSSEARRRTTRTARKPRPSGENAINMMPSRAQYGTLLGQHGLRVQTRQLGLHRRHRVHRPVRSGDLVHGHLGQARSRRTLPAVTASAIAPQVSSSGTAGSTRWSW